MHPLASKVYQSGWNAATNGQTFANNPYPDAPLEVLLKLAKLAGSAGAYLPSDFKGATSWQLWTNGMYDWLMSSFNCEAKRRYMRFREDYILGAFADYLDDSGIVEYQDGSAVRIRENEIVVYDKKGVAFLHLRNTGPTDSKE